MPSTHSGNRGFPHFSFRQCIKMFAAHFHAPAGSLKTFVSSYWEAAGWTVMSYILEVVNTKWYQAARPAPACGESKIKAKQSHSKKYVSTVTLFTRPYRE